MRSLYRENIHDITSNLDKNSGKAKDYRLIALMNRKQGDLCDGVRLAEQPLEGDTLRKIVKE